MTQVASMPVMPWSKIVVSGVSVVPNSNSHKNIHKSTSPGIHKSFREVDYSKYQKQIPQSDKVSFPVVPPLTTCSDELDESNTRLFLKGLSPEIHSQSFLYATFRVYGAIRMLVLNSKRHNALIEYEEKESAATAKKECKCVRGNNGRIYGIKIFWGKHINRELPLKKHQKKPEENTLSTSSDEEKEGQELTKLLAHKTEENVLQKLLSLTSSPSLANTSNDNEPDNPWCFEKSIWSPEYSPWIGSWSFSATSFQEGLVASDGSLI